MSVGSSFLRANELHKIVAGCSDAFAIQTLTQITHGSVLPFGPTLSRERDCRTISILSEEIIMKMAGIKLETNHLVIKNN